MKKIEKLRFLKKIEKNAQTIATIFGIIVATILFIINILSVDKLSVAMVMLAIFISIFCGTFMFYVILDFFSDLKNDLE